VRDLDHCRLCGELVPEGQGVMWEWLRRRVHLHPCYDRIVEVQRDYSRSKKGRLRKRDEIEALLRVK
jgi:hypothetical protein